jgi:hypothetical protein
MFGSLHSEQTLVTLDSSLEVYPQSLKFTAAEPRDQEMCEANELSITAIKSIAEVRRFPGS